MADISLPTSSVDYTSLSSTYNDFAAPVFKISCSGQSYTPATLSLRQLTVHTTVEPLAEYASFQIQEAFDPQTKEFIVPDGMTLGGTIDIELGYGTELKAVFTGYITSIGYEAREDEAAYVTIGCMDMTVLMMKTYGEKAWQKKKYSDVAREIASSYAGSLTVDATSETIENIAQYRQDDYHFLQELAFRSNRELLIVGKSVYFRKAAASTTPYLKLGWGAGLIALRLEHNIASQWSGIKVQSWDPLNRELLSSSTPTVVKIGDGTQTGSALIGALGTYEAYHDLDGETVQDVQNAADSLMQARSMELVSGSGECVGIPELRAGVYVAFTGLGTPVGRTCYLTGAIHVLDEQGYTIQFEVKGNAI